MPRLRIEGLGKVGLITDVPPGALPPAAWTRLYHCTTQDGALTAAPGEESLASLPLSPIYNYVYTDPTGRVYACFSDGRTGTGSVYVRDSEQTLSDITPATGWLGGITSFCNLNGILVVNSQHSGPHYWPGGVGKLTPLPGWDPKWTCTAMVAYRYYLVALGMREDTSDYPHKVRWSNSAMAGALPTQWVAAVDNDAGSDIIGDTPGPLVGGAQVRDALWLVKTDGLYSMDWIGGDFIMQIRRLEGSIGTKLTNGFVPMRGGMAVLTNRDLVFYDGSTRTSLVDGKVRQQMFGQVNEATREQSRLFYHDALQQLFVAYRRGDGVPASAGPALTDTLVLDMQEGAWSHRMSDGFWGYGAGFLQIRAASNPLQWDQLGPANGVPAGGQRDTTPYWVTNTPWVNQPATYAWDTGVYSPSTPELLAFNSTTSGYNLAVVSRSGFTSWDAPIASEAVRLGLRLEGTDGISMVTEVWPELFVRSSDITLTVEIGMQDTPNGKVTWSAAFPFTPDLARDPGQIGEPPTWAWSCTPRLAGRYMAIRVRSAPTGTPNTENTKPNQWALSALTVQWERHGER